ncbi:MAG: sialidase family protein [Promethearchaeota archaeon]
MRRKFQRETVFTSPDYNAFPKLLRLQNGSLWCVWYRGNWHIDTNNAGVLVQAFSHDNGATWGAPTVLRADPSLDTRNPAIAQLEDGSLLCAYLLYDYGTRAAVRVEWVTSHDEGRSWSAPKVVEPSDYNPSGEGGGRYTWASPYGDFFRKGSELLSPFYGGSSDGSHQEVFLLGYDPEAGSWTNRGAIMARVGKIFNEAKVVEVGGEYLCVSRGSGDVLYYSHSPDCESWSGPSPTQYKRGHAPELVLLGVDGGLATFFCSYRGKGKKLRGGRATYDLSTKEFWCEDSVLYVAAGRGGGDAGYSSAARLGPGTIGFVNYEVVVHGKRGDPGTTGTITWHKWELK